MRVLYVNPMKGDTNPAIDAIGFGLQAALAAADIEMRVLYADFREADCIAETGRAISAGVDAGVDAVCFYALDPTGPAADVAAARSAGVPVFSFVRPFFPVNAAVLFPNFNHGVLMAEWVLDRREPPLRAGIIGGPDTPDDTEEVAGLLFTFGRNGVDVVNDPTDPGWCNLTDVAAGGADVTRRLLETYGEIDVLVPYNDETMLGALDALEDIGRPPGLTVISRNGSPPAVEMVRLGRSQGTWDLDASGIGTTLGELVARHLGGDELDGFLGMSPVGSMVDADSVDSWVPWDERVTVRPFVDLE